MRDVQQESLRTSYCVLRARAGNDAGVDLSRAARGCPAFEIDELLASAKTGQSTDRLDAARTARSLQGYPRLAFETWRMCVASSTRDRHGLESPKLHRNRGRAIGDEDVPILDRDLQPH